MAFKNTREDLGERATLDGLISGTLSEFSDDYAAGLSAHAFRNHTALTSLNLPNVTSVGAFAFVGCTQLPSVYLPSVRTVGDSAFKDTGVKKVVLPKWDHYNGYSLQSNNSVEAFDFTASYRLAGNTFNGATNVSTIVLRYNGVVTLQGTNVFNNSPYQSGKAGGIIYVPEAHLASYQSATNWSTILGYGNGAQNQIKSIESTHTDQDAPIDLTLYYIDGTPLPT